MTQKNLTRIAQLRQMKSEIRGSNDYMIVGIDIAKESHLAFFGTPNGKRLSKRLSFKNDEKGFSKLLLQVETIRIKNGIEKVLYGLEPTANYHKPLAEYLILKGNSTVLVDNWAAKNNRSLLDGRWDKNDAKDSANVADLLSQGKCLYYDYPSDSINKLRGLLSLRRKLKKQEHSFFMRIRNHLVTQFFPEMDKFFNKLPEECCSIVKHCLDPKKIDSMDFSLFFDRVTTRRKSLSQVNYLKKIYDLAGQSIGCKVTEASELEGSLLVESLRHIQGSTKKVEKEMETLCKQIPEYYFVLSIPGFGPIISAMVLGAIGDPNRFKSGKAVLKLAGLDLSASRSGKYSMYANASISKKGKAELRYGLYHAANIASSRVKDFIIYFNLKVDPRKKEKGIKTKMRVKLSGKMLIIAWTLMKKKVKFDSNFLVLEKDSI